MSENLKYFIVDVFAEEKYTGNQLAVFLDLEQRLSSEEMLQITREIDFAESTFIRTIEDDGSFGVRIFTTEYEVPFAGHPTLGTAYIIAKHLNDLPVENVVLKLKKGAIPVAISKPDALEKSRFTMKQAQPEFGDMYHVALVSNALNIPLNEFDATMPIEEISTGLPYLIIFLKDLETIENITLHDEKVLQFLSTRQLHKSNNARKLTTSLFFVTKETTDKKNDYHTRMFVLENGKLWEDSATGSANGCLLAYLLKHQQHTQSVVVEQGFEMNRRSILHLDGELSNNKYNLKVGGQVVPIAEGNWYA